MLVGAEKIPDALCHHGHEFVFHFLSHPGVMALCTVLEMRGIVRMKANFTQENIDGMREYDEAKQNIVSLRL